MSSDLWKHAYRSVKSDKNEKELSNYLGNKAKTLIKNSLMKIGTKVYVIGNEKKLRYCILETPGLQNIQEKIPYMKKVGVVIDNDVEVGHSKVSFRDNKKIWFPITALKLLDDITVDDVKYIETDNLIVAKKKCRKKQIKSIYDCCAALSNKTDLNKKIKLRMVSNLVEDKRMNLREIALMHKKQNDKYIQSSDKFNLQISKIKKNRCFDKIKLPKI